MTTEPDIGAPPAWAKKPQIKPIDPSEDIYGRQSILVAGDDFEAVVSQVKVRGGQVTRFGMVPGHNSWWELDLVWPGKPVSFLHRVQGAEDWPPRWIFENE